MERGIETNHSHVGGWAPGFRFYPTEEELLTFYLMNQLEGKRPHLNRAIHRVIPVLDIYDYNPWELPQFAGEVPGGDSEQWFFFVGRQESEEQGGRARRVTGTGYWKGTGSPGYIYSSINSRLIGVKRSMVFYVGRAPSGTKTQWKLNEYKAIHWEEPPSSSSSSATASAATRTHRLRHEFSLCRVYKQSKMMRSFDRRPVETIEIERPRVQLVQLDEDDSSTSSQEHGRSPPDRLLVTDDVHGQSSQASGSSSAVINGQPSETSGSSNAVINCPPADEQPIWDWEELENWYSVEKMRAELM